jgi:hypothetical protein
LDAHYNDLSKSNPGFLGKLVLQDYALLNQAMLAALANLARCNRENYWLHTG